MYANMSILPAPPRPRDDRLVMVARRGAQVLARWALPGQVRLGRSPRCDMELPLGLAIDGQLHVALTPDGQTVRVTVVRLATASGVAEITVDRQLEFGQPLQLGACSVAFFEQAPDGPGSAFGRETPTLVRAPRPEAVEQDVLPTCYGELPRPAGRGGLVVLVVQEVLHGLALALASLAGWLGGWAGAGSPVARRVAATLREEAGQLDPTS